MVTLNIVSNLRADYSTKRC